MNNFCIVTSKILNTFPQKSTCLDAVWMPATFRIATVNGRKRCKKLPYILIAWFMNIIFEAKILSKQVKGKQGIWMGF